YVFYDAVQVALGTVPGDRVALSVGAVVISRPTPERAVIDAGSKTFGLDKGPQGLSVVSDFGRPIGLEGALERLSEEHGILRIPRIRRWPSGTTCGSFRTTPARSATWGVPTSASETGSSRRSSRSTPRARFTRPAGRG